MTTTRPIHETEIRREAIARALEHKAAEERKERVAETLERRRLSKAFSAKMADILGYDRHHNTPVYAKPEVTRDGIRFFLYERGSDPMLAAAVPCINDPTHETPLGHVPDLVRLGYELRAAEAGTCSVCASKLTREDVVRRQWDKTSDVVGQEAPHG